MMRHNGNSVLKSLSTSVISTLFQTAPEYIVNTTLENERSDFQNIVNSISNVTTDYIAGGLINNEIAPVPATLALSGLLVTKMVLLKDDTDCEVRKKDISKEIFEDIASATTQRSMSLIAKSTLGLTHISFFQLSSILGLFAVPAVQRARIPGEPQVAPEDRTLVQTIGQGFVNSAIAAGLTLSTMVALSPTVFAVAFIGSGTAIIANTILGKKPLNKTQESSFRIRQ